MKALAYNVTDPSLDRYHALYFSRYALYTYEGSDDPDVVDSGRAQNNIFDGNTVVGGPQSIKMKESDGTQIINNEFVDAVLVEWDDTTDNLVADNTGLDDVELDLSDACFAEGSDDRFEPLC